MSFSKTFLCIKHTNVCHITNVYVVFLHVNPFLVSKLDLSADIQGNKDCTWILDCG